MIISDKIYGRIDVKSAALVELINSKSIQRLKGIAQLGMPSDHWHLDGYSRYEHSVGVMLLLKKLGATEEEQIAGLLHDVSHTAFSHIIDWIITDRKASGYQDEYQDSQHVSFIKNSEIPETLNKYGYTTERITDYSNFGLLERDLPDPCADRVDYALREFPAAAAKTCIAGLAAREGRIVFKTKAAALTFAQNFLERQVQNWGGFESASRYHIAADILKLALSDKIITMDDFWQDDAYVINKLRSANNQHVNEVLNLLQNRSLAHLEKSSTTVYTKFRHVDPLYIAGDKLARLSDNDKQFAQELEQARASNKLGIQVPQIAGAIA